MKVPGNADPSKSAHPTRSPRSGKRPVQVEQLYRAAIESASGVPYQVRFKDNRPNAYEYMGANIEELLGIPAEQLTPQVFRDRTEKIELPDAPEAKSPEAYNEAFLQGELPIYQADVQVRTAQGQLRWLSDRCIPLRDEETGRVIGSLGILQDITERKQTEELLRRANEELEQRVEERIRQLSEANVELKREIARRKTTEHALRQSNQNLAALNAIARALVLSRHPGELADRVGRELRQLMPVDAFFLDTYPPDGTKAVTLGIFDTIDGEYQPIQPLDNCIDWEDSVFAERILRDRMPVVINREPEKTDLNADKLTPFGPTKRRSASLVFIPLTVGTRVNGVLSVQSYTPGAYRENEIELLQAIARQIAPAVEGAMLSEQLKESTKFLNDSEARYRLLFDSAPDGVNLLDEQGKVVECNLAVCGLYGRARAEILGESLEQFMTAASRKRWSAHFDQLKSLKPIEGEIQVVRRDGSIIDLWRKSVPLIGRQGRFEGVLGYDRDITDPKRASQELLQMEQLRRDFVANVSHEFKTPLTSILGYAETLLNGALQQEDVCRRFLKIIHDHALRLSRLTDDLLKISLIDEQQLGLELRSVALPVVIQSCIEIVQQRVQEKEQILEVNAPADLPPIYADSARLREILLNLLDNAISYCPKGAHITVLAARASGRKVLLQVADNGIGISAKEQKRIFERFYRVDTARSREVGGTGLGLAIVKQLVEAHGGRIELESKPEKGSTFSVFLPQA